MKYWVYKNARILGPLDKEGVSGLPGLDADTLVCSDEAASVLQSGWRPAGELQDFAGLTAELEPSGPLEGAPLDVELLAELRIGSRGPSAAPASAPGRADLETEALLREARERVAELAEQVAALRRRVAELEVPSPAPELASPPEPPAPPRPEALAAPAAAAPAPSESVASSPAPAPEPERPPEPEPPRAKPFSLGRPRRFKVVPALKSLRVVASEEAVLPAPLPAPASLPPPGPLAPPPAPSESAAPAPVLAPEQPPTFTPPAAQPPVAALPVTLAVSAPSAPAAEPAPAPPSTREVLARLSRPEPAPPTAPEPEPPRTFYFGGPALVVALVVLVALGVGYVFLRHPKDLRQMASLDDGRERVGAQPLEDAVPSGSPPAASAPAAFPLEPEGSAPAASSAVQPTPQARLDAAVALVQGFPLSGGRGTIAQWLQYSFNASPNAGQESWNASGTTDRTVLVEYRFIPSVRGARPVHYLFETDMEQGFVVGKSLEARQMLAGGGAAVASAKPAPARARGSARASRRRTSRAGAAKSRVRARPAPLPEIERLRPPAQESGAFSAGEEQAL
ncbi:MAG: hypothetical protein HY552_04970 [Elusimicrobia bacterium]|nr:hypothetical protein [Elusimicrobiota bacterium]